MPIVIERVSTNKFINWVSQIRESSDPTYETMDQSMKKHGLEYETPIVLRHTHSSTRFRDIARAFCLFVCCSCGCALQLHCTVRELCLCCSCVQFLLVWSLFLCAFRSITIHNNGGTYRCGSSPVRTTFAGDAESASVIVPASVAVFGRCT
jgi:hypothetical protein